MKKIILAAMAVCAVFAGCNNDGNDNPAEMKSLRVQLPEDVVTTRAVEAPVPTGSTTVLSDVSVFLLNGISVVEVHDFTLAEITAKHKDIKDVPSTVNTVLVVANVPPGDLAAIKALTASTAIQNYAYTLASQSATGISDKLHIGSSSAFTLQGTNPIAGSTNDYYLVSVILKSITARFEIGNILPGEGIANIKIEGVWINNYPLYWQAQLTLITDDPTAMSPALPNYWATSPAVNKIGSPIPLTPATISNAYVPPEYYDAYNSAVGIAPTASCYAYTLFAGSYVPHLIMLVSGEYAPDFYEGTEKYFLAWVTFTKFTNTDVSPNVDITAVEANKIYKALGGIKIDAKDITELPEQEEFDLGIDITITPWTEMNVTPGI